MFIHILAYMHMDNYSVYTFVLIAHVYNCLAYTNQTLTYYYYL